LKEVPPDRIESMLTLPEPEKFWHGPRLPLPMLPVIDEAGYSNGFGRRKSARARAAIRPGTGRITINGRNWLEYFPQIYTRSVMLEPIVAAEKIHQLDIQSIRFEKFLLM